ncbi:MAG: cupin domain-containing protein [Bryobacterales bacterium]|nr:cupin domain-containing protein [Bryobacterales bacterium]
MQTKQLPEDYDTLAPDGSEIRILAATGGGSMVHCSLPPGQTSLAVAHRTVEEVWYFLTGRGEVWRKLGEREEVVEVSPGASLSIPLGAHFQFRNTGDTPLRFVLTTIPPWPGTEEAYRVPGHWPTKAD